MPKVKTPEQELNARMLAIVRYLNKEKLIKKWRRFLKRNQEVLKDQTDPGIVDYLQKDIDECNNNIQHYESECEALFVDRPYLRQISQLYRNGCLPDTVNKFRKPIQG